MSSSRSLPEGFTPGSPASQHYHAWCKSLIGGIDSVSPDVPASIATQFDDILQLTKRIGDNQKGEISIFWKGMFGNI